jgi:galactokinase
MAAGKGNDGVVSELLETFRESYGPLAGRKVLRVRTPGRTELAGNHTDHEGGHVIAGAVDRYVSGVFSPHSDGTIRILSKGYGEVRVNVDDLEPHEEERGTTVALVRGMASLVAREGFVPAGFDAVVDSDVPAGSGLSSSAAFELELGQAMNWLWAEHSLPAIRLAQLAQADEHRFFGKPCGLMDQSSVALGGIQHMCFADVENPEIERLDFDFSDKGYAICLVAVGSDHSDLIDEYAAIPNEMHAVAHLMGAERLGDVDEGEFLGRMAEARESLGDRAVLRAIHYWREDRLVEERAHALLAGDMGEFCELTRLSGASSAMYLQNVSVGGSEQGAMVALALADELLGRDGACRIHGGGFGGTIQAFVPKDQARAFADGMDCVLGAGACGIYAIEQEGARAEWM